MAECMERFLKLRKRLFTADEALDNCEKDINEWLEETEEFDFPCDAEPLVEKICIGKEINDGRTDTR